MTSFQRCRGAVCDSFNFNDYDPKECQLLAAGRSCEPCEELTKVDEEAARAYDQLADVARRRQIIKERVNHRHDTLIQSVPVEIVSRIFTSHVDDIKTQFDLEEGEIFGKRVVRPALVLAAVCRSWRQIATTTPQLWSTANISIGRNIIPEVELATQWIARSGRLPLDISLSLWPVPDLNSLSPLFHAIRKQAPRWRRLLLQIPSDFYPILIKEITSAPSLEFLQLHHHRLHENVHGNAFHIPYTPILSSLQLDAPLANLTLQWDKLTTLQAHGTSVNEILELFHLADQLIACKLELLEGFALQKLYPLPTAPVVHLSLKDFEVSLQRCYGQDEFETLLDKLVLPSLDRFVYHSGRWRPDPDLADHFTSLFTRSQCPLTTLEMKLGQEGAIDFRFLENLPTIRYLSISGGGGGGAYYTESNGNMSVKLLLTDSFWRRLSGDASTENKEFLPRLESLNFEGIRGFSWVYFMNTINSLWGENTETFTTLTPRSGNINIHMDLSPYVYVRDNLIDADALPMLTTVQKNARISLKILAGKNLDLIDKSLRCHGLV